MKWFIFMSNIENYSIITIAYSELDPVFRYSTKLLFAIYICYIFALIILLTYSNDGIGDCEILKSLSII